jgi:hypothetical protein
VARVALVDEIRSASAEVASEARRVRIEHDALERYAASLPLDGLPIELEPRAHYVSDSAEEQAAFVMTLDAINFGSGWFPTIRKRPGLSGYFTVATTLKERFEQLGPWPAEELAVIQAPEVAVVLGQDPDNELMALYAHALRELGEHVAREFDGRFLGLVKEAGGSAVKLVELLAGWPSFVDVSTYARRPVPFFKRAQIAASDLAASGVADFADLDRLTLFADNLVPHVLRLDGVLRYDERLAAHIDAGQLIEHGSPEEVEIRACATHAVELIAGVRGATARDLDYVLWNRGQEPRYKAHPRHRTRCTAY